MDLRLRTHLVVAGSVLAMLAAQAPAAEHVTLRNGFDMICSHHAKADRKIRLFLSSDESNYIEVAPEDIAGVENVPDPPAPPPESTASVAPTAPGGQSADQTRSSVRQSTPLNPADLREMLANAGHDHHLDVDLLASVVKAESGGNANAVSRTGARGLMQLMPGTASELGVADSFRPDQNVRGGSTYLDALLTRYHDNMALALAAYNAGPAAVDKYHGVPPYRETRLYVARVIHEFNRRVLARQSLARDAQARRAMAATVPQNKPGQ